VHEWSSGAGPREIVPGYDVCGYSELRSRSIASRKDDHDIARLGT